jgi:hypothetical protein
MAKTISAAKVADLLEKAKTYQPIDGRLLIAKDPDIMVKQKEPALKVKPGTEKKGKDGIPKATLEKDFPMILSKYQTAWVLAVSPDEKILKPGDHILYITGSSNDVDVIKGVSIMQRYNVAAIISNNE